MHNKAFIKIDRMLGHKTSVSKFKRTEIVETTFSNTVKLNMESRTKICIENPHIFGNKEDISK